jgi:hypothetical protein
MIITSLSLAIIMFATIHWETNTFLITLQKPSKNKDRKLLSTMTTTIFPMKHKGQRHLTLLINLQPLSKIICSNKICKCILALMLILGIIKCLLVLLALQSHSKINHRPIKIIPVLWSKTIRLSKSAFRVSIKVAA